jgi:hypothetical protein
MSGFNLRHPLWDFIPAMASLITAADHFVFGSTSYAEKLCVSAIIDLLALPLST